MKIIKNCQLKGNRQNWINNKNILKFKKTASCLTTSINLIDHIHIPHSKTNKILRAEEENTRS